MRNLPLDFEICGAFMKEMAGSLIRSTMRSWQRGDFHSVSKVYGTDAVTGAAE
jgi:hypothetical protein